MYTVLYNSKQCWTLVENKLCELEVTSFIYTEDDRRSREICTDGQLDDVDDTLSNLASHKVKQGNNVQSYKTVFYATTESISHESQGHKNVREMGL